ncbi:MAG: DUF1289 domain-containing protein [Pseudomonadota bacterium]
MADTEETEALRRAVRPAEAAIETPCVQVCVLHPETHLCIGCARTGDEIAGWRGYSPETRRSIMDELPTRQANPGQRRGGASARRVQPRREADSA